MLNKLKKSNNKGFTIIEVMIVLAIAGLIILIVLLAVPALQRNARNTSLKNDASAIAGAVNEFKSNNDGAAPTGIGGGNVTGGAGTAQATYRLSGGATVTPGTAPTQGNIQWAAGACPGATANARSIAVWYTPETTGTAQPRCIDA